MIFDFLGDMADLKIYKARKAALNQHPTVKHIKIVALNVKVGNSSPATRKALPGVTIRGSPSTKRKSLPGIKNKSSLSNRTEDDTLKAKIAVKRVRRLWLPI
jgi:hypothetical protein